MERVAVVGGLFGRLFGTAALPAKCLPAKRVRGAGGGSGPGARAPGGLALLRRPLGAPHRTARPRLLGPAVHGGRLFPEEGRLGALWSCKKMAEPSGLPVGRLKLMTPFPGVCATKNETSLADYADKICVVHLYTG